MPLMLTKDDKSWIVDNFVTRGEFRSEIKDMKDSLARIEKLTSKTLDITEGFAGKVDDLEQENKMGAITLHRHGIQIQELATATGTTLSQ